jgi:hypothetical protein
VVVEDVLAREPPRDEPVDHRELLGLLPDLWLVFPQPEQLRTDGLGGAHGAAAFEQDFLPVAVVQLLDLSLRARVYTV